MSRKTSQEKKILQGQHSSKKQQLNIIDFILQKNFQEKAPSTIGFSASDEQEKRFKECEGCNLITEQIKEFITNDMFNGVIEKMWNMIKKIEEEYQRQQIKIGNLERGFYQYEKKLENQEQQYNNLIQQELQHIKEFQNTQDQLPQVQLDKSQIEKLEKKVSKEVLIGIKNIEDNLFKTVNKEIQAKFMVVQEKQIEIQQQFSYVDEQIQMLSHKHSLTREECDERINSINQIVKENNDIMKTNNNGINELTQHYSDMDTDIIKLFQHIKTLLQTDYKVAELDTTILSLKNQITQLRNAINEIGDFGIIHSKQSQLYRISLKKSVSEKQQLIKQSQIQPIQLKQRKLSQIRQQSETQLINKPEKKVSRQLTYAEKSDFLYFLYKSKNGQKNEKQFTDFLRSTYNYEPPQNGPGPSKKGLIYLSKREETDESIKKLTMNIMSPQENMSKIVKKEQPLDFIISQMFEKQLERFPKVRQRIQKTQ